MMELMEGDGWDTSDGLMGRGGWSCGETGRICRGWRGVAAALPPAVAAIDVLMLTFGGEATTAVATAVAMLVARGARRGVGVAEGVGVGVEVGSGRGVTLMITLSSTSYLRNGCLRSSRAVGRTSAGDKHSFTKSFTYPPETRLSTSGGVLLVTFLQI